MDVAATQPDAESVSLAQLLKGDQAAKFAQKLEDFEKKAGATPAPAATSAEPPMSFN